MENTEKNPTGQDTTMTSESPQDNNVIADSELDRFLLFTLGQVAFGTPLLGVREIIEPQEVRKIPSSKEYFLGVINVRGQIIGVFDLRKRLGYDAAQNSLNVLIVFEIGGKSFAALVDKVESVVVIGKENIDDVRVKNDLPSDFYLGVGKIEDNLINLIDLRKFLSNDEILEMNGKRVA